jgi:hypothetical protein
MRAAIASSLALRRYRARIRDIRQLAQDVRLVNPSEHGAFLAREQAARRLEPEDVQGVDGMYPKTFIAERILTDQVASLKGPGVVALVGLTISFAGSAMSIWT